MCTYRGPSQRLEDGIARVACRFAEGTFWLTRAAIAGVFQTTPQNITLHIAAIYEDQELQEDATCKEYLQRRPAVNRHAGDVERTPAAQILARGLVVEQHHVALRLGELGPPRGAASGAPAALAVT